MTGFFVGECIMVKSYASMVEIANKSNPVNFIMTMRLRIFHANMVQCAQIKYVSSNMICLMVSCINIK